MEGSSTFDVTEYKYALDKQLENVMPDGWHGHKRLAVYRAMKDRPVEQRAWAFKALGKALRKDVSQPVDAVKVAVEKKFG